MADTNSAPPGTNQEKNHKMDPTPKPEAAVGPNAEYDFVPLLKKFGKVFGCMFFGYVIGYANMTSLWLPIATFMWILRDKNRHIQQRRVEFERAVADDERNMVKYTIQDLPCWVLFPDTERAEWINKIFKQMWPFLGEYVKNLLQTKVQKNIDQVMPDYCKGFRFEKIDLGTVPLRLGSVKCYDENTSRDEIILDLELIYAGNCDIQCRIKGLNAGIKDFQLYGIMRVELKPLIKDMPLIGCISVYFLKNPVIEFNFTNIADVLDFPGLSELLRNSIKEQIGKMMVLPNKFVYPMIPDLKGQVIKFIQPLGVVRLEVIEARHLKKADVGMLGMGKSDPYVNIIIGNQEFRTPTIFNTINPKWNFICETLAFFSTQSIDLDVMDEDQGSKDDFLGRISFPIETIVKDGQIDAWVNLKDTKTGRIHVRATWIKLKHSMENLETQTRESETLKREYGPPSPHLPFGSVACLLVYLDCAKNLPLSPKAIGEPSPQVILKMRKLERKSMIKTFTINPIWEENFSFLLDEFSSLDDLIIEVVDTKTNRKLGEISLKMNTLIERKNMTYSDPLTIRNYNYNFDLHATISLWFCVSPRTQNFKIIRDESMEESDTIPAVEDFVKATVEPIAKIGGMEDVDVIELSQPKIRDYQHQNKSLDLKDLEQLIERNGSSLSEDIPSLSRSTTNTSFSSLPSRTPDHPMLKCTLNIVQEGQEEDEKLEIIAHKARFLPKGHDEKAPDTYVKLFTVPDQFKSQKEKHNKSVVIKNNCNPVYEERFLINLHEEFQSAKLVVLARTEGIFKKNKKPIGEVEFNAKELKSMEFPMTKWFEIQTHGVGDD